MKSEESSRSSVLWALVLVLVGLLAVTLPMATSFAVVRVLAWLYLLGGLVQLIFTFRSQQGEGRTIWKGFVALLYLGVGFSLLTHPRLGLAGLTLTLAVFICAEGIMDLGSFVVSPKSNGSFWLFFHGTATLILGVLIWRRWPVNSIKTIGILAGVAILLTGITRLALALTAGQAKRA